MTKTLYLVRHGEAMDSSPGRLVGRTDAPLSERGRRQAAALQGILPVGRGAKLVSSPLRRARETAALAWRLATAPGEIDSGCSASSEGTGVSHVANTKAEPQVDYLLELDPDLVEVDFGEWEGCFFQQLEQTHPDLIRAWAEFRPDFAFPGGERLADFKTRIRRAAARLAAGDEPVVVVFTHGGVIRSLVCHFLGLPFKHYLLFDVPYAAVVTLRLWGERGVLSGLRAAGEVLGESESWVWRRSS